MAGSAFPFCLFTVIKGIKVNALYLLMNKRSDKRYIYVLICKAESLQDLC